MVLLFEQDIISSSNQRILPDPYKHRLMNNTSGYVVGLAILKKKKKILC